MKSPESSLYTDTIVTKEGVMSAAEIRDETSNVDDNVNKSNWDAKWIYTTNVDEWWYDHLVFSKAISSLVKVLMRFWCIILKGYI